MIKDQTFGLTLDLQNIENKLKLTDSRIYFYLNFLRGGSEQESSWFLVSALIVASVTFKWRQDARLQEEAQQRNISKVAAGGCGGWWRAKQKPQPRTKTCWRWRPSRSGGTGRLTAARTHDSPPPWIIDRAKHPQGRRVTSSLRHTSGSGKREGGEELGSGGGWWASALFSDSGGRERKREKQWETNLQTCCWNDGRSLQEALRARSAAHHLQTRQCK